MAQPHSFPVCVYQGGVFAVRACF